MNTTAPLPLGTRLEFLVPNEEPVDGCVHCTGIHPGVQCRSCDRPEPGVCAFCIQYARDVR